MKNASLIFIFTYMTFVSHPSAQASICKDFKGTVVGFDTDHFHLKGKDGAKLMVPRKNMTSEQLTLFKNSLGKWVDQCVSISPADKSIQ